ncbi:MAG: hypothetical protein ABIZ04_18795 [Opitutus sp.]
MPSWVATGAVYFVTICAKPRRQNQLCTLASGDELLRSAVLYHTRDRWFLRLIVLMPDHLHALIAVPQPESLGALVRMWKSYQTKTLGIVWQSGFFDHRLRSDESLTEKAHYIRMNPERAGLVGRAADWPYTWPR